jgi:hypothetical protein
MAWHGIGKISKHGESSPSHSVEGGSEHPAGLSQILGFSRLSHFSITFPFFHFVFAWLRGHDRSLMGREGGLDWAAIGLANWDCGLRLRIAKCGLGKQQRMVWGGGVVSLRFLTAK